MVQQPTDVASANGVAGNGTTSVIHDIGYQRYEGARLGRSFALWSLYVHSMRSAFGIGRGAKAKIFPWLIIAIATAYALIVVAVRTLVPVEEFTITYRAYAVGMSYPVMMFLAIIAPELVSRDLRDKVLPLYFSRPLKRSDYALTKLAAMISAVLLLLGVPQLVIFAGAAFSQDKGWSGAWTEFKDLVPGLVAAGVYALVLSGLSLLVASLTGRRAFAAAGVVAVFLITTPVVGIIYAIGDQTVQELAWLGNPMTAVTGVMEWFYGPDVGNQPLVGDFGPVYGLATLTLVATCVALLLARYRKVAS